MGFQVCGELGGVGEGPGLVDPPVIQHVAGSESYRARLPEGVTLCRGGKVPFPQLGPLEQKTDEPEESIHLYLVSWDTEAFTRK